MYDALCAKINWEVIKPIYLAALKHNMPLHQPHISGNHWKDYYALGSYVLNYESILFYNNIGENDGQGNNKIK